MINTEAVDGTDEGEMYVAKGSVPASLCEVCNTLGHRPAVRYVIFSLSAFAFSGGGNDPRPKTATAVAVVVGRLPPPPRCCCCRSDGARAHPTASKVDTIRVHLLLS